MTIGTVRRPNYKEGTFTIIQYYDSAGYSHPDEYSYIYLYSDDGNKVDKYMIRVPSSLHSAIFLILLFLFNLPDDNLGNTATSHYGDDTAPSPNIIFIYEVILVWGFSL